MARICDDDALGYRARWRPFAPGEGLRLDDSYRLAHLPLVAPDHPDVIPALPGRYYDRGRHPTVRSLIAPIPWMRLEASPAYRELDYALRGAPFAAKIAWEIAARRCERLHATVVGSLAPDEAAEPALDAATRAQLAALAPFEMELRGLFSGDVNRGRLYLKAYPEARDGGSALAAAQAALGRPAGDLFVVGLHNLRDHLDAAEAAALSELIEAWWDRPILRWSVDRLQILASRDDLVLDAEVEETIALAG